MGDLTLFEALTGGAFDRLNWQHSGEFDQNFSKKSNAPGFARGGGMGGFGIDWYTNTVFGLPVVRRLNRPYYSIPRCRLNLVKNVTLYQITDH